jgi:hypothetical protein
MGRRWKKKKREERWAAGRDGNGYPKPDYPMDFTR